MRITINISSSTSDDSDLLNLDIFPDTTVSTLKDSVHVEQKIPPASQHIYHNGQLLTDDTKTMEQLQVVDGDMLALHVRTQSAPRPQQARQQAPQRNAGPDPETIRLQLLGNPRARQQAAAQSPELVAALENPERFAQVLRQLQDKERQDAEERRRYIERLNADPFDIDAQTKIAEMIREERVQENLQNAMEHNPEVFGNVQMLYIDVEVQGHKVKAFVDSGAQATIMSPSCAETCGIMRLVDKRFAGIAKGVGTAAILGRVHSAQIKIGTLYLPCSFTVMEGKDVDLLLGLDMLKRHQACIDLTKDKLVIQGIEVPFLGEADIPKNVEEVRADEPKVPGPGGTAIGARSGAITGPSEQTAPSGSAPGPSSSQPPPQQPSFPAEKIDQLVALGFSKEASINALAACGGNVEYAAGLLYEG
ncbi:hypothetical protein HYFRA_00001239 [Hymenoscyphus fraxineus]|uniref:DNA damage-inducible protein 1 n=1 Tax=Hymenoscyphus fraxineus TaxID=746836 RepID=A0A9N9PSG2_9HELO|nr:hypothetical protein HYFRA_00001239 [Hymenoscyphus fraxineus]